MITLRWYQREAIDSAYAYLRANPGRSPCIVLPTGAGKSAVMSQIAADTVAWGGRCLVLAHVRELLEQGAATTKRMFPHLEVGVYSAGLKRRDTGRQVTYAGIQSIHKKPVLFSGCNMLLIDECHLIPPTGDGMYQNLIKGIRTINRNACLIGLTATPYRTQTGYVCDAEFGPLHEVCYEVDVARLIDEKYLCRLVSFAGEHKADLSKVKINSRGDFAEGELSDVMCEEQLIASTVEDILTKTERRHSVLVFACSIKHAESLASRIRDKSNSRVEMVSGETPKDVRDGIIGDFRDQKVRYLINCMVLTTGFDAPVVDCVAMVRPTVSPGLYYQMVGRGLRLSDAKSDCLILDYGENIKRHGPIDRITPVKDKRSTAEGGEPLTKECPDCHMVMALSMKTCPTCGHVFQEQVEVKHETEASNESPLSTPSEIEDLEVFDVAYCVHTKKNASPDAPKTMRVDYQIGTGHRDWVSEWICVEHDGVAGRKAIAWWSARSRDPMPRSAEQAVLLANAGSLANTERVVLEYHEGEKWPKFIAYKFGEAPVAVGNVAQLALGDDDIPF